MNEILNVIKIILFMVILDFSFLQIIAKNHIDEKLRKMNPGEQYDSLTHPLYSFAIIYLLMAISLYYFVIRNSKDKEFTHVLAEGAFLGLTIYSVFDMTLLNMTTHWTFTDAIIDITWGTAMFTAVTAIAFKINNN